MSSKSRPLDSRLWKGARWLLLGLALLWLGLRVWVLVEVRNAVPEFEKRHGSLAAASLERPVPPKSKNGAVYFAAAGDLFEPSPNSPALRDRLRAQVAIYEAPSLVAEAQAEATLNDLPIQLLRRGAMQPSCEFHPSAPTPLSPISNLIGLLGAARVELLLGQISEEASGAPSLEAVMRVQVLSNCLQRERFAIHQLVGSAVERINLRELQRSAREKGPAAAFRNIALALPTDSSLPSVSESARFELLAWQPRGEFPYFNDLGPDGSFWNPLSVRGFNWTLMIKAQDRTLRRISSADVQDDAFSGPFEKMTRTISDISLANWTDLEEKRALQSAMRELGRFALLVRAEAEARGSYLEAVTSVRASGRVADSALAAIQLADLPNGGFSLSIPEALRPPDSSSPEQRAERTSIWEWTLPPLNQ